MTTICGCYLLKDKPSPCYTIQAMMAATEAYPHDATHTWHSDGTRSIAFGCQMHWTTPVSKLEHLPLYDNELDIAIVADARIDNRQALGAALSLATQQVTEMPDSHLILHAYAKWGVDCPKQLLGDFAFAIWDKRQQRLFAARDFIGARPFYYHGGTDHFLFASDMAMLMATDIPLDLDLPYLSAHFRSGQNYPHLTHTFYAGIRKLGQAQAMTVDGERGIQTWTYWEPTTLPEVRYPREEEYAERLRELLTEAVAVRTHSAYPLGSHLSGGLDCSTVAVLAQRQLHQMGRNVTCFSWSPPVDSVELQQSSPESTLPKRDERMLVELLSTTEGMAVHYTSTAPEEGVALRLHHQARHREAFFTNEMFVRRQAVNIGIRTILSGWGGDELISFNGRGYFADLLRRGRITRLLRELSLKADLHGSDVWYDVVTRGIFPLLPKSILGRIYPKAILDRRHTGPLHDMLLMPEFMAELDQATPLPHATGDERAGVRRQQLTLLARGHLTQRIEGWASGGMRAGITYAYPLLDQRVVEFALGLPPQMFFQHGWKRYLFRYATEGILPDEVRWNRTKDEPAHAVGNRQVQRAQGQIFLPVIQQALAATEQTRLLDLERAQAMVDARLAGERTEPGDVMGGLSIEMLVNPELEATLYKHVHHLGNNK